MIDEGTLKSFSHFFPDERQLEKDYLINLMLKTISINKISTHLEFKGGTALYLFHGLDRFSEDLDFTYIGGDSSAIEDLDSLIKPVIRDFGLSYNIGKNKGNVIIRDDSKRILGVRTEVFIEGPLFNNTGTRHKIKIDISFRNDTIMKPEHARLVSKYNDIGTIIAYKMPVEELLIEKFCAVIERTKARDLYDAYFLLKYKDVLYDSGMLSEKLTKRGEKFDEATLINNVNEVTESAWKEELSYIVNDPPDLKVVKTFVAGKIKHSF